MYPRRGDLLSCLALIALTLAGFARLVARPGALLVDGGRPGSITPCAMRPWWWATT
ncbi:MAG: hypothetical protein WKF75_18625 [Singulisphaera sp.]